MLLTIQLDSMKRYLDILEERAEFENIKLYNDKGC